jgi:hypothetical protein
MTVTILKLVNGVEVIGENIEMTSTFIVLKHPMQVLYKMGYGNLPNISLVKYSVFADGEDITFPFTHIINVITPRTKFVDFYKTAVNTLLTEYEGVIDDQLDKAIDREQSNEDLSEYMSSVLENFDSTTQH